MLVAPLHSPQYAAMDRTPNNVVSRDIVRAVLEARDHRHNETHAMLLGLYQALVAELIEQGALAAGPLAERLSRAGSQVASDPHGSHARDMLHHVLAWLEDLQPGLPPAHPTRWSPPNTGYLDEP